MFSCCLHSRRNGSSLATFLSKRWRAGFPWSVRHQARFYWRQLGKPQRVLDLGCATGEIGRFKPDGTTVYGIDISVSSLRRARLYELVQAWDLDQSRVLPFPDNYFDAIVAKDVLEH